MGIAKVVGAYRFYWGETIFTLVSKIFCSELPEANAVLPYYRKKQKPIHMHRLSDRLNYLITKTVLMKCSVASKIYSTITLCEEISSPC